MKTKNKSPQPYWNYTADEILQKFHTSLSGLNPKNVFERQQVYGLNVITVVKSKTLTHTIFEQFKSPLIFILLFAAGITLYLREYTEAAIIFAAILTNIVLSAYQEFKAENTVQQLRSLFKNNAVVMRNGSTHSIAAEQLVPGDILILQTGMRIPADGRIVQAQDLTCDESLLTGESVPVDKSIETVQSKSIPDRVNTVFAGTYITNGTGLAVVVQTGSQTEIGSIASTLEKTDDSISPTQTAVRKMSWYIFSIACIIVIGIIILGVQRGENMFEMLVLASAVAVGAVPEALPIALTVVLAMGIVKISKHGGLIRRLSAAETLGSTTLLLTDKTGTLTEGTLTLTDIVTLTELLNETDQPTAPAHNDQNQKLYTPEKIHLLKLAYSASQATVQSQGLNQKKWSFSGNSFDVLITQTIFELNIPQASLLKKPVLVPFNSTIKHSIVGDDSGTVIVGAPDILIEHSNLALEEKARLIQIIQTFTERGKRVIALARGTNPGNLTSLQGCIIEGFFLLSDPIRNGIEHAVQRILKTGMKVKIISGDLSGTVQFIATQVGLPVSSKQTLTGNQLQMMSDEALKQELPHITVFARVTPADKLRISKLYQELGEIVAMTGDGVNDALALKATDIGISLATATEVAQSASDMVLLKNDFNTINRTIQSGRSIKLNIQKVFIYLMSTSLDEVFVIAGALVAGLPLPLSALQIIWVNVLTGSLPALSYAYDDNMIDRSSITKNIFDRRVKFLALGIGAVSSFLLFGLYYLLLTFIPNELLARSIFFVCFSTYILVISYSFKDLKRSVMSYNPFTNWRLNVANAIGFILTLATVEVSFLQRIFNLISIPLPYYSIVVCWIIINVVLVEISKKIALYLNTK